MRKNIIALIFIFIIHASQAQTKRIIYILPDSVEILIDKYIKNEKKSVQFYFLLSQVNAIYKISIARYDKGEEKNILEWVKQSNRYIVINRRQIPLIFDYDLRFGAIEPENIGEFRHREGEIKKINLMLHGTAIYFNSSGNVVKVDTY